MNIDEIPTLVLRALQQLCGANYGLGIDDLLLFFFLLIWNRILVFCIGVDRYSESIEPADSMLVVVICYISDSLT